MLVNVMTACQLQPSQPATFNNCGLPTHAYWHSGFSELLIRPQRSYQLSAVTALAATATAHRTAATATAHRTAATATAHRTAATAAAIAARRTATASSKYRHHLSVESSKQ
jgi:hypothetical protein